MLVSFLEIVTSIYLGVKFFSHLTVWGGVENFAYGAPELPGGESITVQTPSFGVSMLLNHV